MIQNANTKETSPFENNFNDPFSDKYNNNFIEPTKNSNLAKEKKDNENLSNSGTSFSSDQNIYNNFVSKIKLNYNLINPQGRAQTIILHPNLDKSITSINNDSIDNDNNNVNADGHIELKELITNTEINANNNNNFNVDEQEQLNNGFMLDNSSNKKALNNNDNNNNAFNDDNNKRNAINYLNKLYEDKIRKGDEDNYLDNNIKDNYKSSQANKDNVTINFNNNMFFLNDNNGKKNDNNKRMNRNNYQSFPVDNIFSSFKPTNDEQFKDKVFASQNEFVDNYPGLKKGDNNDNDNNILLPYGFQNNPFCNPNQNNNYLKKDDIYEDNDNKNFYENKIQMEPKNLNYNKNKNSPIEDLSTNINTNKDNYEKDNNNKNNNGISSFNLGNNNPSVSSLNFEQSFADLNNNKNYKDNAIKNNDENNTQFGFNPYAHQQQSDNNINTKSQLFPANYGFISPDNINKDNDLFNNAQSKNVNCENNSIDSDKNIRNNKDYPEPKNDFNYNDDFENQNVNKGQYSEYRDNLNINKNNAKNLNHDLNSKNKQDYYPLDIIGDNENRNNKNNQDNQEIIYTGYEDRSLRTSLDNSENDFSSYEEFDKKSKDKKSNALKSLLYGLLLGSTVTGLFWLRKEDTRKYLWEKLNKINFESIINLFKSLLHPLDFFQKVLSEEKRKVYLKVLGISFSKLFDFLEKYGDAYRLLGTFIFVYAFWLIIKSFIRAAIKVWKHHN
jgi:hypothetical protein